MKQESLTATTEKVVDSGFLPHFNRGRVRPPRALRVLQEFVRPF